MIFSKCLEAPLSSTVLWATDLEVISASALEPREPDCGEDTEGDVVVDTYYRYPRIACKQGVQMCNIELVTASPGDRVSLVVVIAQ